MNIVPTMSADKAVKYIYSQLLSVIKANEQGVMAAQHSEYLHDFRVAVRKTRSGLTQLKGVLPKQTNDYYCKFFSWLGKLTGSRRDLDVYLALFEQDKQYLPLELQQAIQPLYYLLLHKQQLAQVALAEQLSSTAYLQTLAEWSSYLHTPTVALTKISINRLANRRIKKVYRRVLREGSAISASSIATELHELRKTCKKLRYLLEFFCDFYAREKMKILFKQLKALQDVLGEFQDGCCQEVYLVQCRQELQANNATATTLLAVDNLIEKVIARRLKVRENFAAKFAAFKKLKREDYF